MASLFDFESGYGAVREFMKLVAKAQNSHRGLPLGDVSSPMGCHTHQTTRGNYLGFIAVAGGK